LNFCGGATPAFTHIEIERDEFVVAAEPDQSASTTSADPFEAVNHEHRLTNRPAVVREVELPIEPVAAITTGEQYRGPRGALLAFKNTR